MNGDPKLHKVCDYVIGSLSESGDRLNVLKLHKLLYYIQAWHLAFYDERFFDESFQAWINGPVSRSIYDRFVEAKSMYSPVGTEDRCRIDCALDDDDKQHIENVLEAYGHLSEAQLVTLTHNEDPCLQAREGYEPDQRCYETISEEIMKGFYRNRMQE